MGNAVTDSVAVATDLSEKIAVVGGIDAVADDTGQGCDHAGAEIGVGSGGKRASLGEPVRVDSWTRLRRVSRAVACAVDAGGCCAGDFLGVVAEVDLGGDGVSVDGDKTVVVGGLKVHVHDTTAPDIVHLGAEENRDVAEGAGLDGVATVLGEEDGDGVVGVFLGTGLVAGALECLVSTPLVDVVAEEVDGGVLVTTVQVVRDGETNVGLIGCRVADTKSRSVALGLDVGLHIASSSSHKGSRIGLVGLVDNLVTGEEPDHIGIVLESVDDGGVSVVLVHGPGGRVGSNGDIWGSQIGNDIDAGIGELLHTLIVILGRVHGVRANDVCA